MEHTFYASLATVWATLAVISFVALFKVDAPYGRHARPGWGPALDSRWAWFWMELLSVLSMPVLFVLGGRWDPLSWLWLLLWEAHYIHRTFVFPFRPGSRQRATPWSVVGLAMLFNSVNGYLNGRYLFTLGPERSLDWLARPHVLLGVALFVGGMALNVVSDRRLLALKARSGSYAVPRGGAFRWVSCPNYLGEIIEWVGWAVATSSPGGWVFALWTVANLAPRARANHRWYRERFADYPANRKALIPGLW